MTTFDPKNAPRSIADMLKERTDSTNGNDTVIEQIVEELTKTEIQKRTEALLTVVRRIEDMEKEIAKIKPEVYYDAAGVKVSEVYSKQLNDKRNKLQEDIDKINKAIDLAFTRCDWTKIKELIKE